MIEPLYEMWFLKFISFGQRVNKYEQNSIILYKISFCLKRIMEIVLLFLDLSWLNLETSTISVKF
jgi:hypothetical protein